MQTRLREATGPDSELDKDISTALNHYDDSLVPWGGDLHPYDYTTDPDGLGACVALMRSVLPRWLFDIRQQHQDDFQARVYRRCLKRTPHDDVFASHRLATHATLLAIVSALIAIEEAKEKADV
ncbi:hypothetical protein DLM45_02505 [Hyphomicrobium methylovorum]|nr:hypothetical protein [Hyphomicrobium methylovorum]